jgi:hypothetical protein
MNLEVISCLRTVGATSKHQEANKFINLNDANVSNLYQAHFFYTKNAGKSNHFKYIQRKSEKTIVKTSETTNVYIINRQKIHTLN